MEVKALDATTIEEVVSFLDSKLGWPHQKPVIMCDDADDIGYRLSFGDFLKVLPDVEKFRPGHLYICDEDAKLFAIIHLALWTYVKV